MIAIGTPITQATAAAGGMLTPASPAITRPTPTAAQTAQRRLIVRSFMLARVLSVARDRARPSTGIAGREACRELRADDCRLVTEGRDGVDDVDRAGRRRDARDDGRANHTLLQRRLCSHVIATAALAGRRTRAEARTAPWGGGEVAPGS